MNEIKTNTQDGISKFMTTIESRIDNDFAKKINSICTFEIGVPEKPEIWTLDCTKDSDRLYKGSPETTPVCTIAIRHVSDCIAIIQGEINPTVAFMQGKIKIKGDISMALKMQSILSK